MTQNTDTPLAATTVEFDCVDCHQHIYSLAIYGGDIPKDRRCLMCHWIAEHIPTEQQDAVRQEIWSTRHPSNNTRCDCST